MEVILERSKEEEVSGEREREIIEEHVFFLQERAKLMHLRLLSFCHTYLQVLFN
jgi:hypothetical protein